MHTQPTTTLAECRRSTTFSHDHTPLQHALISRRIAACPVQRLWGYVHGNKVPILVHGTAEEGVDEVGAAADVQACDGGRSRAGQLQEVLEPVDVVGAVGERGDELSIGDPPVEAKVHPQQRLCGMDV